MQSKVKLTKRQVKEDKFTTFMLTSKDRLQEELEDKWQYYVIGLVLVVVVIWAVSWHFSRQSSREVEASESLSKAMMSYQAGDNQVASLEFSQIAENYSGSLAAEQATYLLGNLNLSTRSFDAAIENYQKYLSDFKGDKMTRAASYAGMAAAHEDLAQYAQAADNFNHAAQENPDGPLVADYLYGAVRNYLADGNVEQARQVLDRLEKDFAAAPETRKAQISFAEHAVGQ